MYEAALSGFTPMFSPSTTARTTKSSVFIIALRKNYFTVIALDRHVHYIPTIQKTASYAVVPTDVQRRVAPEGALMNSRRICGEMTFDN